MKKMLFLLALAVIGSLSASAISVTYSTAATISCPGCTTGNGTSSVTFGTSTISFSGLTNQVVTFTGTSNISLGTMIVACTNGTTTCGTSTLPSMSLALTVTQSAPPGGSPGTFPSGVLTGTVSGTSANAQIQWGTPAQVSINSTPGPILYSVSNNPLSLVPPTTNNGRTTIQGKVTDASVPEPTTYLSMGVGLLALGLLRRRIA